VGAKRIGSQSSGTKRFSLKSFKEKLSSKNSTEEAYRHEAFNDTMATYGRMAAASTMGMGGLFYSGAGSYGTVSHCHYGREERYPPSSGSIF
jgi:ABC-type transporter lipoprotein component MlaA